MAEETTGADEPPKKKSKLPLLIGGVLALLLGAGGFYVTYSGMLTKPATETAGHDDGHGKAHGGPEVAFVPLEPLLVTLGRGGTNRHLRFKAQLEVVPGYLSEVEHLTPRVLDVLNSYLRAIELSDVEAPAALVRLRAQMLRRIQIAVGDGRVNDFLITEFVLN